MISRRDFLPFGEELTINVGARSSSLKYGADDDIRQKFTGYQKDEETKLDFAEPRMYENRYARFTAVDPLLASGKSSNPQTFNRYVYVGNSPLVLTDPTGLFGDYYSRTGEYLGSDPKGTKGYNDGKTYFAEKAGDNGNITYYYEDSLQEFSYLEVLRAVNAAPDTLSSSYAPHHPGDVREPFWRLGSGVQNGVNDGINGIAKAMGKAPAVVWNDVTGVAINFRTGSLIFQGTNPLEVPLPFSCSNAREVSYGSARSQGTILGVGFAAGALSASSGMLSVVPRGPRGAIYAAPKAMNGASLDSLTEGQQARIQNWAN